MSKTMSIEQEQRCNALKSQFAMSKIKNWNQQELDRLAQAIGWYSANEDVYQASSNGVDGAVQDEMADQQKI